MMNRRPGTANSKLPRRAVFGTAAHLYKFRAIRVQSFNRDQEDTAEKVTIGGAICAWKLESCATGYAPAELFQQCPEGSAWGGLLECVAASCVRRRNRLGSATFRIERQSTSETRSPPDTAGEPAGVWTVSAKFSLSRPGRRHVCHLAYSHHCRRAICGEWS
jgi:hypothetical protein